jgi:transposase
VAEKRGIVEETLEPGASVARVAQRHAVNANQVFHWRRPYSKGLLCEKGAGSMRLLPVAISDVPVSQTAQATCAGPRSAPCGTIQVELPKGHLRVTGSVDAEALRTVLEQLLG